jgi:hypothetical protein
MIEFVQFKADYYVTVSIVARLYCKRPILCLASSKILIPHPLIARRVCTPPPLVRVEDTLAGWRGGWGVNILEYVSILWFLFFLFLRPAPSLKSIICPNLVFLRKSANPLLCAFAILATVSLEE